MEAVDNFISLSKKIHLNEINDINNDLSKNKESVLAHCNANRMAFGTAGLRAEMGYGYDRMNALTIVQTCQGFTSFLLDKFGRELLAEKGVVIGYDARHNSAKFALLSAVILRSVGAKVILFNRPTFTPLNPFTICEFGAIYGIQVTASHNPKADNGYKVYGENGAQIIPPTDSIVGGLILKNLQPWSSVDFETPLSKYYEDPVNFMKKNVYSFDSGIVDLTDEILADYLKKTTSAIKCNPSIYNQGTLSKDSIKFCYTAMHGVGYEFVDAITKSFGIKNCLPVPSQQYPDAEFPTVVFPNPEEKGALDLAVKFALENGADYVLANDPDADRFTSAELDRESGKFRLFSGNEIGVLFANWVLLRSTDANFCKAPIDSKSGIFLTSAVSSQMLSALAKKHGCVYDETLTGFKWMANRSIELRRDNPKLTHLLAYEESIGYQLTPMVPDKDGVSALAAWCEMVQYFRCVKGQSLSQVLANLKEELGYFSANNSYYYCKDTAKIDAIFAEFRAAKYSIQSDNFKVVRIRDVTTGYDSGEKDEKCTLPLQPDSHMITIFAEGSNFSLVVTIRTSGTEPKIKYYTEVCCDEGDAKSTELVMSCGMELVEKVIQPGKYGL